MRLPAGVDTRPGGESGFELRRAVERLREGLFDPVAVRLLTVRGEGLGRALARGLGDVSAGRAAHLCICGAYGQGKSHTLTWVQEQALGAHFATSMVNLDPRETPLHDLRQVWRALVARLRFPDAAEPLAERWRRWAAGQTAPDRGGADGAADLPAGELPHLFRAVLAGLARQDAPPEERPGRSRRRAALPPREATLLLSGALAGEPVPVARLRQALAQRQVPFHREASLVCRGAEAYLQALRGLGRLCQRLGYGGWVLLFDEGEAVAQLPVTRRSRSYEVLHGLLGPAASGSGLYPVFAFTDDFFQRLEEEDYARTRVVRGEEVPCFARHYARAWRDLTCYRLQDLSARQWQELGERLTGLHARAYGWRPPAAQVARQLGERLDETRGQETRLRLKALVDQLDLVHQERVYGF